MEDISTVMIFNPAGRSACSPRILRASYLQEPILSDRTSGLEN